MKPINKAATKTFLKLVDGLAPGEARRIDNGGGAFMAVSVDFLSSRPFPGAADHSIEMYAVAHRFEQNGDLIPDPDVEFCVIRGPRDIKVCPTAIDQSMGYRRSVHFGANGLPEKWNRAGQADLASFCGTWLRNIKGQQLDA